MNTEETVYSWIVRSKVGTVCSDLFALILSILRIKQYNDNNKWVQGLGLQLFSKVKVTVTLREVVLSPEN